MKLPFDFLLFICCSGVTGLKQCELKEIINAVFSNFYMRNTGVSCTLGTAVYFIYLIICSYTQK